MDYSQLSDFEINKRVADFVMNGTWHVRPSHPDNTTGGWLYGSNGIQTYDLPDYCNSPEYAWPIIFSNRMFVDPIGVSDWSITSDCDRYREISKNPLRAAMCVFLMLKEKQDA